MATEIIQILVRQRGARAASASIRQVGTTAKTTAGSVGRLRGALLALGVGIGIRELTETVDAFINIKNRVKLATDTVEEYNTVSKELFSIAQETRVPLEATAELYRRLAVNTRGLNFSQERLLDLIRTINQSVAVSGATAKEARSGLIQLAQGFASGQIRGEEFRSVAEQLPGLLIAVADGLGKTIGELRELAFAGELTPELFSKAVESQAAVIDATFKQIIPTIAQAGTQLNNAFIQYIGKLNEATEGSTAFRGLIGLLRENMEQLGNALISAAAAYGLYRTAAWLAAAANKAFAASIRSVLIATGIGAVVVALGIAIDLLLQFGLSVEDVGGTSVSGFNKMGAAVTATVQTVKRLAVQFGLTSAKVQAVSRFIGRFLVALYDRTLKTNISQFRGFVKNTKKELNFLIGFFAALPEAIKIAMRDLPLAFKNLGIDMANFMIKPLQDGLNSWIRETNRVLSANPFSDFTLPEIDITLGTPDKFTSVGGVAEDIKGAFSSQTGKDFIGPLLDTIGEAGASAGRIWSEEYNEALKETVALLQKQQAEEDALQKRLDEVRAEAGPIAEALELNARKSQAQKTAITTLATLVKSLQVKEAARIGPLQAALERYEQARDRAKELGEIAGTALKDNEAYALALGGIADTNEEIARLTQDQADKVQVVADLINRIAEISPEFAQQMRDARDAVFETGGGLAKVSGGLDRVASESLRFLNKNAKEAERAAEKFGKDIASEISDVFSGALRGEAFDFAEFLAEQSAKLLEKSLQDVFTELAKSLQGLIKDAGKGLGKLLGGGEDGAGINLGAGLGALVGVGGLLLSSVLQGGSSDIQNELADQATAVTDVRPVRGVVAGPTNIPIFQLGQELEDAFNPTNAILEDILAAVSGGTAPDIASAVSLEDEAGALLNATTPTLI